MRGRDTHGRNSIAKRVRAIAVDVYGKFPRGRVGWLNVAAHAYRNGYAAGRARALYVKAKRAKGRR